MGVTKRSHYNPCFWTAFWSPQYYEAFQNGEVENLTPREQVVYALNVKSNRILETTVDDVHYEKNIGAVEITFEAAMAFVKRNYPNAYKGFHKTSKTTDYPIYLDVENLLTDIEGLRQYREFLRVIKNRKVDSFQQKIELADCLFIQMLRSHAVMNAVIEWGEKRNMAKFEYFIYLNWMLSDPDFMYSRVMVMINQNWIFYRTPADTFPLSDTPILANSKSIMVALSPRLLLEIPSRQSEVGLQTLVNGIDEAKLKEFRNRTIGNSIREIIFGNRDLLEEWQATDEFKQRRETIQKMGEYSVLLAEDRKREFRQFSKFGNPNPSSDQTFNKRKRHTSKRTH